MSTSPAFEIPKARPTAEHSSAKYNSWRQEGCLAFLSAFSNRYVPSTDSDRESDINLPHWKEIRESPLTDVEMVLIFWKRLFLFMGAISREHFLFLSFLPSSKVLKAASVPPLGDVTQFCYNRVALLKSLTLQTWLLLKQKT